jgi:hypothetical protein
MFPIRQSRKLLRIDDKEQRLRIRPLVAMPSRLFGIPGHKRNLDADQQTIPTPKGKLKTHPLHFPLTACAPTPIPTCRMKQGSHSKPDAMQLSRFLLSALVGSATALFTALLFGSLLPRFPYSYEVLHALMGAVFVLAAGFVSPQTHRWAIAGILVVVGTIGLALLEFRGEPLSFFLGACLAYAFHWRKRRAQS